MIGRLRLVILGSNFFVCALIERSSISLKSRCHSGAYGCRCMGSPSRTGRLKTRCAGDCNSVGELW